MNGFEPVNVEDIPPTRAGGPRGTGKWQVLLREFLAAEVRAARVTTNGESDHTVRQGLEGNIRLTAVPVDVIQRNGTFYLVRTDR